MAVRLAGFAALSLGLTLCACRRPAPAPVPSTPLATPTAVVTPPPVPFVPNKRLDTGRLFNGFQYRVTFETEQGTTATAERDTPSSYSVDLQVKVKVPKAHKELDEIGRLNKELPVILPQLPALLETARISPLFETLYRLKVSTLQQSLNRLDTLLSRHNFFDCETILEIQHPQTKRRAVFMQADMDVDTDGSDSDRAPDIDALSATFQPFTSYKWSKKGSVPNGFITPRETRLKVIEQELGTNNASATRQKELKETQARLKGEISDLKKYSYLVASLDPFVVLPSTMVGKKTPFSPAVGDYCVVIYDRVLYPAVVGDIGPTYKTGEGSLRICRQLSPRADENNRPVSDLKVTYLVFPGSADKPWDIPDLNKWRARCEQLVNELGGHQGELFAWEDLATTVSAPASIATPSGAVVPPPAPNTAH